MKFLPCIFFLMAFQATAVLAGETFVEQAPAQVSYAPAFEEVLNAALQNAPMLPAAKARRSAAESQISSAYALPDPYMEMTGQAMGISPIGPSSSLVLEYRQELLYPGKRAARKASARAAADVMGKEIEDLNSLIREEVGTYYANIYALDRELRAIMTAEELLLVSKRAALARYSTAGAGKDTLLKFELSHARLRQRRAEITAERRAETAQLNRYLGAVPDAGFGEVRNLPELVPAYLDDVDSHIDSSAQISKIRAKAEAASLKMKELKTEEKPDFLLGGGGGIDGDVNPVVMLRMGVTLPLWKDAKQSKMTESAMYELNAARADLEDARNRLRTQAAVLKAELVKADVQIKEYRGSIIPNTKAVFNADLSEYMTGKGDFSTLLEDLNSIVEASTRLARSEADRLILSVRLERITAGGTGNVLNGGGR